MSSLIETKKYHCILLLYWSIFITSRSQWMSSWTFIIDTERLRRKQLHYFYESSKGILWHLELLLLHHFQINDLLSSTFYILKMAWRAETSVFLATYKCSKIRCTGKMAPPDENLVNAHSQHRQNFSSVPGTSNFWTVVSSSYVKVTYSKKTSWDSLKYYNTLSLTHPKVNICDDDLFLYKTSSF